MIAAVTYDNGNVFQHFGKTQQFKLYEIRNSQVLSTRIFNTDGIGHEALAGLLAGQGVDLVICGGLGDGAQNALNAAGIMVVSGAQGNVDEAVQAWLRGELASTGVNCDHHEHEHEEAHACGGDCGSGCGGCCGGPEVIMQGKNAGKTVRVHYKGTFNDGTQFDSSYDRGQPLEFICGTGMMIPGFDKAVLEMEPGEEADVHLMPEDAYGMPDERYIIRAKIAELPGSESLSVGDRVYMVAGNGQQIPVTVKEKTDTDIVLDANHEMAGKELNFHIELVSVD